MNDGMDTFKAGRNRYVALCAFVGKAESASPKLKRRGDRFRRALAERQKREFAKRLPTLETIMAKHGCDINAARSIRARMEVEADRAHFRKTGKHALAVISAHDLARHPELAVKDMEF